jgi:hypothetical protein
MLIDVPSLAGEGRKKQESCLRRRLHRQRKAAKATLTSSHDCIDDGTASG